MPDKECPIINPECAREFGELQTKIDGQVSRLEQMHQDIRDIYTCIKGNGVPGLSHRVYDVEARVKQIIEDAAKAEQRADKGDDRRWRRLALLASFSSVAVAILSLIATFGR
jgi:hypothetical protein